MFTTPNTVYVPPDYQIETDVPSIAEFVTCSLDGRLWVFRRSRRYYVAVLKWDAETQRLVFVSTTILSNTNFIGRGIDWLLTDNTIIRAVDDEPYIITANLFSDNGTSFLYSVLRSKDVTYAWGVSETSGNSEGYGYFYRSALLQSVNKHYSLLPAVGNWNIIGNFLLKRFVNPTVEDEDEKYSNPYDEPHNSMLNLRPLIPLEFNGSTPIYGCGFDNDIFITHFNGELWGRGLSHIGRCYILPAVFDENGTPQEFYLYISPDYKKSNEITQAEWLNFGVLKTNENTYGFSTAQADSLDNELCFTSNDPKIFDTSVNQWQQLSENGQMFIDTLNNSGLVLYDNGALIINTNSYECKGLTQWLAPAGKVDAVTTYSVISSFDNSTLSTYIQQGFNRELLSGKNLPISAQSFSGKKFSLGIKNDNNVKAVHVNSIVGANNTEAIAWENVYKNAVEIKLLHCFLMEGRVFFEYSYPIAHIRTKAHSKSGVDGALWDLGEIPPTEEHHYLLDLTGYSSDGGYDMDGSPLTLSIDIETQIMWINSEIGSPEYSIISASFSSVIPTDNKWYGMNAETGENEVIDYDPWYYALWSPGYDVKSAPYFSIRDNQIGFRYRHYTDHILHQQQDKYKENTYYITGYEYDFQPCAYIPDIIKDWIYYLPSLDNDELYLNNDLYFDGFITPPYDTQNSGLIACFREKKSNMKLLCHVKANFNPNSIRIENYYEYYNISHSSVFTDTEGHTMPIEKLHIITAYDSFTDYYPVFVFKSKLHPEIFDFASEVERSKFS